MRVFLVRHGEAAPLATSDVDRPLTAAGRASVHKLAAWCAANGVAPDEIRHSGLLRAEQTAEILAARLAPPDGVRAVRGLAPDDDARLVADELRHETTSPLIVTHMPFIGELTALLAGWRSPLAFTTAEIACLERDGAKFRIAASWRPPATSA
jgi:phosphohistidine phosphatase